MMKRPRLAESRIHEILEANQVPARYPVVALAIRGYYLDSMGEPGVNDRRIYDDAHFIVWPDGIARFVGNTDPNGYRKGRGTGRGKGMAMLRKGIHIYGTGLHKGTKGFRQCELFTVMRDGWDGPYADSGMHAINWHSGSGWATSWGKTSSLGCQTNPPDRWRVLQPLVYRLLEQYDAPFDTNDWGQRVRSLPYVLCEEPDLRAGELVVSRRYFPQAA